MNRFYTKFLIILVFITFFTNAVSGNEENPEIPNYSIGFSGTFGLNNTYKRKGNLTWKSGSTYGGQIVFEKMFSNRFGIHSGVLYTLTNFELVLESGVPTDYKSMAITIPFYLITSFNLTSVSLNILLGLNFSHVFYSKLFKTKGAGSLNEEDVLDYINYTQVGVAGGLTVKFRISTFTDFFIGGISEFYFTNAMRESERDIAHAYNFRAITGFLFRTNIFPIPGN